LGNKKEDQKTLQVWVSPRFLGLIVSSQSFSAYP
jgi:hypothetical protein